MAVVTADFLAALYTNYRAIFVNTFLAADKGAAWRKITTPVPSTTLTESYNWLGSVPKMSEWIDRRNLQGLLNNNYSIVNKHFEASLAVDRDTLEDDRWGMIRPRIQQLAQEAARYPDELVFSLLDKADGATGGLCYDGQYMADTDHTDPGGDYTTAQSNKLTGTGVTLALVEADFAAAKAALRNFRDDRGRFVNLGVDGGSLVVVAPPALETVFSKLLQASTISTAVGPVDNVLKGAAELVVTPWLTDANDWFLLYTGDAVKPLIFQNRKAPEFVGVERPDAEHVFMSNKFLYGVDMRCNVGWGDWRMLVMTTNT